jgi:hypothetical protein
MDGHEMWHVNSRFWFGDLRERNHLEYFGVDGRIILKRIFWKWNGDGGVHWIDLKDRNKWRAVANRVMNIRV